MTATRDTDRLIRAYLDEGITELSDRAYDEVRLHTERTRQRVVIGPWRNFDMPMLARALAAAAIVVAAAVLAINVFPGSPGEIGAPTSPSPLPSPSAAARPVAMPTEGPLDAGTRYVIDDPNVTAVPFSLTVPDGWRTIDGSILVKTRGDPFDETTMSFSPWRVGAVYRDPCRWTTGSPQQAGSPEELVQLLQGQRGRVVGLARLEVDGFGATRLDMTWEGSPPDETSCDNGNIRPWANAGSGGGYGHYTYGTGQHDIVWIIETEDEPFVLHASYLPGTPAADRPDIDAIIGSIDIAP